MCVHMRTCLCVSVLMPVDSAAGACSVFQHLWVCTHKSEGLTEIILSPTEQWGIGYVWVQHILPQSAVTEYLLVL